MRPGEQFELRCYEYLKKNYASEKTDFNHEGGMNSTKSDIAAIINGKIDFYIEVKDASAQSGQFVLLPDLKNQEFIFSPRNHSEPNEMTNIIINYMNSDFPRFNNAGTAGETLDIDTKIFADWIIDHYKRKNVKYIISYDNDYVIFPIRKFEKYFNIIAKYRIKKSGSCVPSAKDIPTIKKRITEYYTTAQFYQENKKLFVSIPKEIDKEKFILDNYTYYLSKQNSGNYEVRRLSNTYNMNVIFSVNLIKTQDKYDLEEFKSDI